MVADVKEDGQFYAGIYWPGVSSGGAFFIRNTVIRSFNTSLEADVKHVQAFQTYMTQWNAATSGRQTVHNKIDNANYPWGQNELKAERDRRRAEYERQNPSLFGGKDNSGSSPVAEGASVTSAPDVAAQEVTTPPAGSADRREGQPAEGGSLTCPTMSEVYQSRIDQDRLRLSDLAWLCSDELRERIPTVQALRVTAESASERAKTMADLGQPADAIAPYAQQAKEAVEGYQAIYQAVDEELAIQFKRLSLDQPYIDRFKARFKGVDIEKVLHICRPYYEKIREQEKQRADEMAKKGELTIDERIRLLIERDNPEYAARMKAEEAKKEEVADILRYLKRKDKDASDTRLKTAREVKFPRLVELIGEKEAKDYPPTPVTRPPRKSGRDPPRRRNRRPNDKLFLCKESLLRRTHTL